MSTQTVAAKIASLITAIRNCERSGNLEWLRRHADTLEQIRKEYLPSGAGFDCGTLIDVEYSTGSKLIMSVGYHYMNPEGYYDGWVTFQLIVRPTFDGIEVTPKYAHPGNNDDSRGLLDYMADTFHMALSAEYKEMKA